MFRSLALLTLAGCFQETTLHKIDSETVPDPTTPSTPEVPVTTTPDPTLDTAIPASELPADLFDISFFQVVQVPAVQNSVEVPIWDRPAPLVADRDAVVSILVEVPEDFTPADVEARVEIDADGTLHTATHTRLLERSSDPADRLTGFVVDVPADAVVPGATYSVSLWADDGTELGRFPETGRADLAPEETGPLKVRLVPMEVDGFVPDTSPAVVDEMAEALFALYPVTEVQLTVGTVWDAPIAGLNGQTFGDVFQDFGVLQEQQGQRDEYWYGMITGAATRATYCQSCGQGAYEHGGGNFDRAYNAMGAAFGDELSVYTLVHELAHTHQLTHAPCGDAGDTDPAFPQADGTTGIEGYDVRTGTFLPTSHFDVMGGECTPYWISGYNYDKLVDWVQHAQTW